MALKKPRLLLDLLRSPPLLLNLILNIFPLKSLKVALNSLFLMKILITLILQKYFNIKVTLVPGFV